MRGDLIEVYKIFHAHIDLQWDHFFEAAKTRNSEGKIFVKQFHSNVGKSTFSNIVTTNWNNLPAALKFAKKY